MVHCTTVQAYVNSAPIAFGQLGVCTFITG